MSGTISTPVVVVELLAGSIWVGSMVCLAVVTDTARRVLDASDQVTLFGAIGRRYATVGTTALLVAIGAALWLVWPPTEWSGTVDAAVGLAGFLVLATLGGIAQARAMTRLRRQSIRGPGDTSAARALRKGRQVASALRGAMAASTLAIVMLTAQIINHGTR